MCHFNACKSACKKAPTCCAKCPNSPLDEPASGSGVIFVHLRNGQGTQRRMVWSPQKAEEGLQGKRKQWVILGLPWWSRGEEFVCQCRGHGFNPWSGKIPYGTGQISLCIVTLSPHALEPVHRDSEPTHPEPVHRDSEPTHPEPVHRDSEPTRPEPVHRDSELTHPEPVHRDYWAHTPEPVHRDYWWAPLPQQHGLRRLGLGPGSHLTGTPSVRNVSKSLPTVTYTSRKGSSLVVQWLRLHLPMQGVQVWSLVWELNSHMPRYQRNIEKKKTRN